MRVITAVLLLVSTAAADFAHARTADGLDPLPDDTRPSRYKLLVEEFALSPQSVSKYRLAVSALRLVPQPTVAFTEENRPDTDLCLAT